MKFESLYDFLICTYRITNKTNTIPIITGTQAPIVPPTIAGKFSDKDNRIVVVSKKNELTNYSKSYTLFIKNVVRKFIQIGDIPSTHWYPSSQP